MRYLSVCSGIEAATVAWHPLGWQPVAFAEIDRFPAAVLAHHYPTVPNWGDLSRFHEWPNAAIDLLVGGTPCQSFSVAGLRKGLDDPRGSLLLTYLAIARRYRPRWLVWENVPGVLSIDGGRAFGALLGGLAELGYGFAYRVLDAQYFGLAQRRARVFVVGHLGDWRRAAAVLFERASLSGHPPPRRETGQDVAGTIGGSSQSGGFRTTDLDNSGAFIPEIVPQAMSAKWAKGSRGPAGDEIANLIAHSLRADGFDASEDGTGRGTPLVPVAFQESQSGVRVGEAHPTLDSHNGSRRHHGVIAFDTTQITHPENRSNPLVPAVAFAINSHAGAAAADVSNRSHASGGPVGLGISEELAYSLRSGRTQTVGFADVADPVAANQARTYTREGSGNFRLSNVAHTAAAVRRLTPRECERLQGFPDDYTLIPTKAAKRIEADYFRYLRRTYPQMDRATAERLAKDGPRYKALGNSMAVPVMRWIGDRIALVERVLSEEIA